MVFSAAVPSGLQNNLEGILGVETPSYFRLSLRDSMAASGVSAARSVWAGAGDLFPVLGRLAQRSQRDRCHPRGREFGQISESVGQV